MTAHYVYEVYDRDARLIYVGATCNLVGRLRAHRYNAWWADQVVKVRATVHPSIQRARRVELDLILARHPRWNCVGHGSRQTWTPEQYRDYVTARTRRPPFVTAASAQHLRRMAAEYRFRFGAELDLVGAA